MSARFAGRSGRARTLAFLLLVGCGERGPARPDILLFSIDTLRADHLGCYGYERATSPNIDDFARSATRFTQAYAPTPWTLASHAEILTGRHPYQVGITSKESAIPADVPIVAESLAGAGYSTAAFVDSTRRGYLGAERGFSRGFERYSHAPHLPGLVFEYDMQVTLEVAIDWIRRRRDPERPFFLFLHTKSVHTTKDGTPRPDRRVPPYDLPEPHRFRFLTREQAELEWSDAKLGAGGSYLTGWNRAFEKGRLAPERFPADQLAALEALYDGAIYYVDQRFGQLLDVLRSEGLYDDMLVVLTADHGEEFLDHGMFNHVQVYRELLRVPLLVKLPRQSDGRVIDAPVRLADIVPTLLEQAGIPVASELEGRPLQAAGRTAIASRRIFGSHHKPPGPDPERKQFSLREGEWTLVYGESRADGSRDVELYHTRVDTTEAHPVEGPAGRVEAMMRALEEWRSRARVSDGASVELDEKTAEDLRALGYVD